MKSIVAILLLGLSYHCAFTQQLDSLFLPDSTYKADILNQAKAWYSQGHFNKAVKTLNKQLKKTPDYFNGYIMLAYLYYDRAAYDRGAIYFAKAIKVQPKHTGALFMRGTCFLKGGRYRLALSDYMQCIKLDRNFYPAYNNIAVVRMLYQDIEPTSAFDLHLAKQDLDEVMAMQSPDQAVVFNMGFIYLLLWQYDQALPFFTKAIDNDASFSKAWYYRALVFYYKRDYQRAKSDFATARQMGYEPERCNAFIARLDMIINYQLSQKMERPTGW